MDTLSMVEQWHKAFGVVCKPAPDISSKEINALRIELIKEEFRELQEALEASDEVETLDALCDLQYVLDGTFLSLGFGALKQRAFEEVHRSNMSKLGEDGKPLYRDDGKVLKGPRFTPPNLNRSFLINRKRKCKRKRKCHSCKMDMVAIGNSGHINHWHCDWCGANAYPDGTKTTPER